jgi:hypothetical protein
MCYSQLSYYFSSLAFLVYLHQYVYFFGDKLLHRCFDDIVTDKFSLYKRRYVIKNLWKSGMLALILMTSTIAFFDGFLNCIWSNLNFLVWGTLYVALDLSGLIYVRGLPAATKVHHTVVCILGTLNAFADYNVPGYYRSILIYTYFSILPFIVNFYLGYRYLEQNTDRRKLIARISYLVYGLSLSLNIFCQFIFFYYEPFNWTILFYTAMYAMIMNDDIKLIQFLRLEAV